jgi:hypothetical protein
VLNRYLAAAALEKNVAEFKKVHGKNGVFSVAERVFAYAGYAYHMY